MPYKDLTNLPSSRVTFRIARIAGDRRRIGVQRGCKDDDVGNRNVRQRAEEFLIPSTTRCLRFWLANTTYPHRAHSLFLFFFFSRTPKSIHVIFFSHLLRQICHYIKEIKFNDPPFTTLICRLNDAIIFYPINPRLMMIGTNYGSGDTWNAVFKVFK